MILRKNGKFIIYDIKNKDNSIYSHICKSKYDKSLNIKKVNPKNKIINYIKNKIIL